MYSAFARPDAAKYVGQACTRILAAYVFVAMGICILDEDLIFVLATPSYSSATKVVMPVTLAYFFWHAANLLDAPLWVFRRTSVKPWIFAISASVTVALYVWLIPSHGGCGAAYATLAGLAVHCGITLLASQRVFPVRYEFGRLAPMLALAIALTLVSQTSVPGLQGLPCRLALWAAWPVILWCAGVVTSEEKSIVRAACSRIRDRLPFSHLQKQATRRYTP